MSECDYHCSDCDTDCKLCIRDVTELRRVTAERDALKTSLDSAIFALRGIVDILDGLAAGRKPSNWRAGESVRDAKEVLARLSAERQGAPKKRK
jgi:hypothetical protein